MFTGIAQKFFGTTNERRLKRYQPLVEAINALGPELEALSDAELQAKTDFFRTRLEKGETLDDILVEAFAVVREAATRVLQMRHFDVQLIGGMVLHEGAISEMKTGEGKTLVATLPAYLNALEGKGVHIVTVNDYLAKRDAAWMGKVHEFLGLSVGCIVHELKDDGRREAYGADITYGTNNEFGFDYLRDNMKFSLEEMVQRPFHYAIVDEVDSILIDEARTPLIISGPVEDNSELYTRMNKYIPKLTEGDYELDEKARSVSLTEEGTAKIEEWLEKDGMIAEGESLYDLNNISMVHHVNQALKAHTLFERDKDYIIKDERVVIIDEFTGRMMEGRRYSEGLHQALEAKEGVPIQHENQTLASITFQNYFRLYSKLAGMTGTAMTEASEFHDIYKLEVVEVPTHMPVGRADKDDMIYRTENEKYDAILEVIRECHARKQPMLIGTASIEKSEYISKVLKKAKLKHNVLNARYHEKEAHIIAQAGRPGALTIATNMAGRGTDIMLGGNPEMLAEDKSEKERTNIEQQVEKDKQAVLEAGGLFVLGTERHESRRIDNQLRGRSGRQGDPGASQFFLSLEDDLLRIFGSEKIDGLLQRLGLQEGEAIQHPWMNRALEKAQQKVEARNYEVRKTLLKFDDVMNDQRKVIFEQRIELMQAEGVNETVKDMRHEVLEDLVAAHIPEKSYAEEWETEALEKEVFRVFGLNLPVQDWAKEEGIADQEIYTRLVKAADELAEEKQERYGGDVVQEVEKRVLLFTLDQLWKDHLLSLDHLRQGINLRAYGQKDPLNEYKREAFSLFEVMLAHLREVVTQRLAHLELQASEDGGGIARFGTGQPQPMQESRVDPALAGQGAAQAERGVVTTFTHKSDKPFDPNDPSSWGKVGRNDPCPCGSGKKYKHCHGKI